MNFECATQVSSPLVQTVEMALRASNFALHQRNQRFTAPWTNLLKSGRISPHVRRMLIESSLAGSHSIAEVFGEFRYISSHH